MALPLPILVRLCRWLAPPDPLQGEGETVHGLKGVRGQGPVQPVAEPGRVPSGGQRRLDVERPAAHARGQLALEGLKSRRPKGGVAIEQVRPPVPLLALKVVMHQGRGPGFLPLLKSIPEEPDQRAIVLAPLPPRQVQQDHQVQHPVHRKIIGVIVPGPVGPADAGIIVQRFILERLLPGVINIVELHHGSGRQRRPQGDGGQVSRIGKGPARVIVGEIPAHGVGPKTFPGERGVRRPYPPHPADLAAPGVRGGDRHAARLGNRGHGLLPVAGHRLLERGPAHIVEDPIKL